LSTVQAKHDEEPAPYPIRENPVSIKVLVPGLRRDDVWIPDPVRYDKH